MDPATWIYIALLVLTVVLAPKPAEPKPASLTDFDIPTAESDRPIPVVFGTVVIKGANVVWYGDLTTRPIYSKGGKK